MSRTALREPISPKIRECDLVKGIVDGLRLRGRTVLVLNQWRGDRAGSTPGAPDVMVWRPMRRVYGFGASLDGGWIGLEVKTPTGRLSEAQKVLADMGAVIVVRSIEEAFAAVGETMRSGGGEGAAE